MKKIKILSVCIGVAFLLQGCVIANTPGFYSGYKKLSISEKKQIFFLDNNQNIPVTNGSIVYAVSAKNVINTIEKNDTTLLYIWGPKCHSRVCASLPVVQAMCDRKGYVLYVVAEYYDMEQINVQPKIKNPLLSINNEFYKTDYCPRYTKLFESELRQGVQVADSVKYARYHLFNHNKFVKSVNNITEI